MVTLVATVRPVVPSSGGRKRTRSGAPRAARKATPPMTIRSTVLWISAEWRTRGDQFGTCAAPPTSPAPPRGPRSLGEYHTTTGPGAQACTTRTPFAWQRPLSTATARRESQRTQSILTRMRPVASDTTSRVMARRSVSVVQVADLLEWGDSRRCAHELSHHVGHLRRADSAASRPRVSAQHPARRRYRGLDEAALCRGPLFLRSRRRSRRLRR